MAGLRHISQIVVYCMIVSYNRHVSIVIQLGWGHFVSFLFPITVVSQIIEILALRDLSGLNVVEPLLENYPNRWGFLVGYCVLIYMTGLPLDLLRDIAIMRSISIINLRELNCFIPSKLFFHILACRHEGNIIYWHGSHNKGLQFRHNFWFLSFSSFPLDFRYLKNGCNIGS